MQAERKPTLAVIQEVGFTSKGTTKDPRARELKDWERMLEVDQGPKLCEEKREDGLRENKKIRDKGTDKRKANYSTNC